MPFFVLRELCDSSMSRKLNKNTNSLLGRVKNATRSTVTSYDKLLEGSCCMFDDNRKAAKCLGHTTCTCPTSDLPPYNTPLFLEVSDLRGLLDDLTSAFQVSGAILHEKGNRFPWQLSNAYAMSSQTSLCNQFVCLKNLKRTSNCIFLRIEEIDG